MQACGLLNINKPRGLSSYDVIRHVRGVLREMPPSGAAAPAEVKVGHAGTLDVLAEGVLVVCLGPAVRLAEVIQSHQKEYVAVACLGATSTTDDGEGETTPTVGASAPSPEALAVAAAGLVGSIEQVPPTFSAVHVAGQRAYRLARRGQEVSLTSRKVEVYSLEVTEYLYPRLRLKVRCGAGTYIRSLVRDIGKALGVGAYCQELTRTQVGPFRLDQAVAVSGLTPVTLPGHLLSPVQVILPEARLTVTGQQARELALGRPNRYSADSHLPAEAGLLGAIDPAGRLVALVQPDAPSQLLRPRKVFTWPDGP
jgi:tRNA pseudouridine55 synthase